MNIVQETLKTLLTNRKEVSEQDNVIVLIADTFRFRILLYEKFCEHLCLKGITPTHKVHNQYLCIKDLGKIFFKASIQDTRGFRHNTPLVYVTVSDIDKLYDVERGEK